MPLNQEDIKDLKNKHQGGINNSKGNSYENFYAVYCIAVLIDKYLHQLEHVYISSQLELCFVDDLLIKEPNEHLSYHQLKDVKKLSWKTSNLAYDFKRQMELSTERNEDFELKLVHSENPSKVDTIPVDIAKCTTTPYFPSAQTINQLILNYKTFKDVILNITPTGTANDDELSGIATVLLGIWAGSTQKDVTLKEISEEALEICQGRNTIKTFPIAKISDQCKAILENSNIKYYISGITLYWTSSNGRMQGSTKWTPEKEKELVASNPTDFWNLVELLN